jgi:DNA-binding ferritin-like protein
MVEKRESFPKEIDVSVDSADKDYDYARANFYNIIETGTEALEQMLDVAKASEHPRAYEVVSTIMKTLVDANKDLVDMSVDMRKGRGEETLESTNTTNNLFVGSTSELQKMLKSLKDDSV